MAQGIFVIVHQRHAVEGSNIVNENPTASYRVEMREDGIARVTWAPDAIITEALARQTVIELTALTRGRRVPLLVSGDFHSITKKARAYYASAEASQHLTAMAQVIGSPVTRMMAYFFLSLDKPPEPVSLFTSESEALEWLKGFIE